MKNVAPTIVRATDALIAGTVSILICPKDIPFVVSVHSDWNLLQHLDPSDYVPRVFGSRKLAEFVERIVFAKAKRIMAISHFVKRSLIFQGVDSSKVDVLYHGIPDPLKGESLKTQLIDKEKPMVTQIVIVGRLSKQKRLDKVLDAAEIFMAEDSRRLLLVGDGPEREYLESRVSASSVLSQTVEFLGFVSRSRALDLVKSSQIVIVPLGGYSLIEAALCGKPVVAFDNEWHAEVIRDGVSGYLVSPDSVLEIASAVDCLCKNEALRKGLGSSLRSLALAKHHDDVAQKNKRDWYTSIIVD